MDSYYQEFIYKSRYARWLPHPYKRRETWKETVSRYFDFFSKHLKKRCNFELGSETRKDLEKAILELKVVPSMRAFFTSGAALKKDEVSGYNCAYCTISTVYVFSEILYILTCGTGVGFSVERQYINKLPAIPEQLYDTDTIIVVYDSKIGWARAYRELMVLLYSGQIPKWDVSKVRPRGARLKTFGGRASGPGPLVDLFKFTINKFKIAMGRKLNSLEVHDIVCKIADIVVSGGVRRSALISLSNFSDERLRDAKKGDFGKYNPQRYLANNSIAYTEKPDMGRYMKEWISLYESKSGERGIFNRVAAQNKAKSLSERRYHNYDFGCNPCSEIILRDCQFCNLSEVILRQDDDLETIKQKIA